MVRTRTPINRLRHTQEFTPEIIDAFTHLRNVYENYECTCPEVEPRSAECSSCKAYDKAQSELLGLFNFKPWQFLANPYFGNPYPPESHAWKRHEEERRGNGNKPISAAYALWWRLEKAAGLEPLMDEDES